VLDAEFFEPDYPRIKLLTAAHVKTYVVQPRAGLVELRAVVSGVRVQPNRQSRARLDEQHTITGLSSRS
jgi:hypothetical protein